MQERVAHHPKLLAQRKCKCFSFFFLHNLTHSLNIPGLHLSGIHTVSFPIREDTVDHAAGHPSRAQPACSHDIFAWDCTGVIVGWRVCRVGTSGSQVKRGH